jgi:hypothetical protein
MSARDEMREAKKEEGLCLHGGCGERTLAPAFKHCDKHLGEDRRVLAR